MIMDKNSMVPMIPGNLSTELVSSTLSKQKEEKKLCRNLNSLSTDSHAQDSALKENVMMPKDRSSYKE